MVEHPENHNSRKLLLPYAYYQRTTPMESQREGKLEVTVIIGWSLGA